MATKEKKHRFIIGDTIEVKNCQELGMVRNIMRGILIWRPMNKEKGTPPVYCIWVPTGLNQEEQDRQNAMLTKMYRKIYGISGSSDHCPYAYDWRTMMKSNRRYIMFVPKTHYNNISFIEKEEENIIVGDLVLDRRWMIRFSSQPIRRVLAIKYDSYYGMNRICLEDPSAERNTAFGYWVYPLLRKNMILVSRRVVKQPADIAKEEETKSIIKGIISKILTKSA